MSGESSSGKWIVGCLIAGVALIVLCGGGLFFVGLLGYRTANQVAQTAVVEMQEQAQQMQFASAWTGPAAGSGADVLFPEAVNAWQLVSHDDQSAIVELGLERNGLHARYESGVTGVDVYAYEVPMVEQTQVFDAASAAIDNVGYSSKVQGQVDDGTSHRMSFSVSPPELHGRLWWCRGWLFVFKTSDGTIDLDAFQQQYLTAIAGQPAVPDGMQPPEQPIPPSVETAPPLQATPEEAPSAESAPENPGSNDNPEEAPPDTPPQ